MTEMTEECCVCFDKKERDDQYDHDNLFLHCQGCNINVHQVCYGILTVSPGPWYCHSCEMKLLQDHQICDLCPYEGGAFKKTDQYSFAHVVCALYIPECKFGSVATMEPILTSLIPKERIKSICYICEESGSIMSAYGACMPCKAVGCKATFHVTCAQKLGLLCQENVDGFINYWSYCQKHYATRNSSGRNLCSVSALTPPEEMVHEQVATSREGSNFTEEGHLKTNSFNHQSTLSEYTAEVSLKRLEEKLVALRLKKQALFKRSPELMEIVTHSPVHSTKVAPSDIIGVDDGDIELIEKDNVSLSKSSVVNLSANGSIASRPNRKIRELSPDIIDAFRCDQSPKLILRKGQRKRRTADFVCDKSTKTNTVIAANGSVKGSSKRLKEGGKKIKWIKANVDALRSKSTEDPPTPTLSQLILDGKLGEDAQVGLAPHMFGNALNLSSSVSKKMMDLLNEEMEAVSAAGIAQEDPVQTTVIGNPIPGPSTSAAELSTNGSSSFINIRYATRSRRANFGKCNKNQGSKFGI